MCLGIPGKIVSISHSQHKLGMVDVGGVCREINLACIVAKDKHIDEYVGAWVLVHVGFAMSLIDELEAARTLELLQQLGELTTEPAGQTQ